MIAMKIIFLIFSCACIVLTPVFGQKKYRPDLNLELSTGDYILERAIFYQDSEGGDKTAGFSLVEVGFETQNHVEFEALFLPGECHVSEDTYYQWKEGLGQYKPRILANFILQKGDHTFGITKYSLSYDSKEFLLALAHKKVNGKWYYLAMDENIEFQDAVGFFKVVKEDFIKDVEIGNHEIVKNPKLFTIDGKLRAGTFASKYFQKYDPHAGINEELNLLFENQIRSLDQSRSPFHSDLENYVRSASIPAKDLDFILNLMQASQVVMAIDHFSKITGYSLKQILEECPNALKR